MHNLEEKNGMYQVKASHGLSPALWPVIYLLGAYFVLCTLVYDGVLLIQLVVIISNKLQKAR
jgi:hypothetical protein